MNDEQIVALYFNRDERAIAESGNRYGAYCTTIAMNILHDLSDSEECVSDTWLGAWRSIPPKQPSNLAAYFGKITRNLAINRYRKNHAERRAAGEFALSLDELDECIPGNASVEDDERMQGITESINRFLHAQKPLDRRVFVCRYFYCDSIADIAARFALSESHIKSLLFRMRARLRTHLEKDGVFL